MGRILLFAFAVCIVMSGCGKVNTLEDDAIVQAAADSIVIHKYLTDNNLNGVAKEIRTTGEFYIIDTLGAGGVFTNSTLITVGFSGKILGSNSTFVNNLSGYHPSYTLGSVIKGWQLGIPFVKKGGTIRLIVPSGFAYGPYPQSDYNLPANAILDFKIKLYDVTN